MRTYKRTEFPSLTQIFHLINQGRTKQEIADHFNVPEPVIHTVVDHYVNQGDIGYIVTPQGKRHL